MSAQAATRQTRQARGHQVDSQTFLISGTASSDSSTVQVKLTGERTVRDLFTSWEDFGLATLQSSSSQRIFQKNTQNDEREEVDIDDEDVDDQRQTVKQRKR